MFHIWYEFLNSKIQDPLGLVIFGMIIFAILNIVKHSFLFAKSKILLWKQKADNLVLVEQKERENIIREEYRKKLDEIFIYSKDIAENVKRINGSVKEHHNKKEIHFEKTGFVTFERCREEHEKFDSKMDIFAKEIFQEIRGLAAIVNNLDGAIKATRTGTDG